jgi:hypothetical protein
VFYYQILDRAHKTNEFKKNLRSKNGQEGKGLTTSGVSLETLGQISLKTPHHKKRKGSHISEQ